MLSKHSQYRRSPREAFTLIEVMIVLFILMVLAGVAVVSVTGYLDRANKGEAKLFVRSLETPLETFRIDHGRFPLTSEGLNALLSAPPDVDPSKGEWPYIKQSAVKMDPWGMPYQYEFPGRRNGPSGYDLWSFGPDMMDGNEDDIGNW